MSQIHSQRLSLSDKVLIKLKELGWAPDRSVESDEQIGRLLEGGFTPTEYSRQLIAMFNGIEYYGNVGASVGHSAVSYLHFDAGIAAKRLSEWDRLSLEYIAGETICPIAHGGEAFLLESRSGRLFLLSDQWMFLLVAKSMNAILSYIFFKDSSGVNSVPLDKTVVPPGNDAIVPFKESLTDLESAIQQETRDYGMRAIVNSKEVTPNDGRLLRDDLIR